MMKHRSLAVIPLVALVGTLVACAPVKTAADPTTSPQPVHTPAKPVSGPPQSRVPFPCTSLYSVSSASNLTGVPVQVRLDETTPPSDLGSIAAKQFGTLGCVWGGGDSLELSGWTGDVSVYIAPEASSQFAENFAADNSSDSAPVLNTAGDQSRYSCNDTGSALLCRAEMRVGNYWVSAGYSHPDPVTSNQGSVGIQNVLATTAAAIRSALAVLPAWVAPKAKLPGFCTDSTSTAALRTIFASPTLALQPAGRRTFDAFSVAQSTKSYASCSWTTSGNGGQTIDIAMLRGGSWAFPQFAPVASGDSVFGAYSPVTVAGASSALMSCADGGCEAYLAVGSTAMQLDVPAGGTPAKTAATLGSLVADIKAG